MEEMTPISRQQRRAQQRRLNKNKNKVEPSSSILGNLEMEAIRKLTKNNNLTKKQVEKLMSSNVAKKLLDKPEFKDKLEALLQGLNSS